jgi:superfamily II DNA/RNA helicase
MGADIVVCTPGKMMSHIKMGYVKLQALQYLILDEADRMLDMGFYDDILFVIKHMPAKRQTLLFSATMPPKIRTMAKTILHNPVEINIAISKPPDAIQQQVFFVYEPQKIPLVNHLLKVTPPSFVLIFCSSKNSVKQLNRDLRRMGWRSDEIHSDLDQDKREEVLGMFRSGRLPILIATDILSRGIDIDNIELVINYDVPHDGEDYVHRIGRTARAQTKGSAYTLVNEQEQKKFQAIEKLLEKSVPVGMVPENLGPVPEYNPRNFVKSARPQRSSNGRSGKNNSR